MLKEMNILIVGVGGQGTILASKILADVAQQQGYDVKVSEIHGMAQRGGSVVTQVRMGEKIYAPIISEGQADIILAFEQLEALRWVHFLKEEGTLIVNRQVIEPVPVLLGLQPYPAGIIEKLKAHVKDVIDLDALDIAGKCGNKKAVNVVLMGVLAKKMNIPREVWDRALDNKVPARFLELNKQAFEAGWMAG
ncbi:Indolepyruvate ferredoxin oxidoreductase [Thermincola ferriacetica]|uniref:Indolepyruvate ferredoxin oxidoreductase n=1 Tax=Thermincola ferriacetica TaxID=281456 RepID=A0A0L6W2H3_9FIRM|nr:indolepyruvate oxidoreductase subunit beta [Thermincola ferriacetica]KNZ69777.1 Indolepyruvate ferredoxin oxidoreductase [Thermincola ferriacetica]